MELALHGLILEPRYYCATPARDTFLLILGKRANEKLPHVELQVTPKDIKFITTSPHTLFILLKINHASLFPRHAYSFTVSCFSWVAILFYS